MTYYTTAGQKINAISANRTAELGSSYQSEKEIFVGGACLKGDSTLSGPSQSSFDFSQSLSAKDAADQLGFSVGGRARLGVNTAEVASRFMKNTITSSYSISSVWLSDYILPTYKLINSEFSTVGESVHNNFERWAQTCGDKYVDEIGRGAKLFFSIRIDFNSVEAKKEFEVNFKISGPLYSANADLLKASREFSKEARITIAAYQIGGDVSKLTGIFGNSDEGRLHFVNCSLGNFSDCSSVIASALKYATDEKEGFPSQIAPDSKPGPSPLYYNLANYNAQGIYLTNYPFLDEVTKLAREKLSTNFESQFELSLRADRLLDIISDQKKRSEIEKEKIILQSNIDLIIKASETCYNNPMNCKDAIGNLKLKEVNENALSLPPIVQGSYRILTTRKGIWDREQSRQVMNIKSRGVDIKTRLLRGELKITVVDEFDLYNSISNIKNIENDDVSIVLFLEGQALKEADLFFENRKIMTISLLSAAISLENKIEGNSRSIVIESTRTLPDWIDIKLESIIQGLAESDMPKAEGFFYIIVKDEFGRKTRFDLKHCRWKSNKLDANHEFQGPITIFSIADWENAIKYSIQNYYNWWDTGSNGTNGRIWNDFTRFDDKSYILTQAGDRIDAKRGHILE